MWRSIWSSVQSPKHLYKRDSGFEIYQGPAKCSSRGPVFFSFLLMALSLHYTEYQNLTLLLMLISNLFIPSQARMITRIHSSPGVSRSNFVKLLDCFTNGSQVCLVYEMLSVDLLKALELRKLKPWSLAQIRPVAKQVWGHIRSADFLLPRRERKS